MQPSTSGETSLAPDGDELSTQSNQRRRTSSGRASLLHPSDQANNLPSMANSSPRRASSRELSPNDGSDPVKYTRTGRVSKATKGQRVHNCDECGKVSRIHPILHLLHKNLHPAWAYAMNDPFANMT
jgi:hypothetical protein